MTHKSAHHPFDRFMNWVLPGIVAVTPLVVIYALVRPNTGQAMFLQLAVMVVTLALGVAWLAGWRALPRRVTAPGWLILLGGVALLGSLAVSRNAVFSIKQVLLPLSGLLLFGAIVFHPRRRLLLERIRVVLVALGGLLALYGILQHFGFEFLRYSEQVEKNRVIATIGHPNYLASFLGPILFLVLSLISAKRNLWWGLIGGLLTFVILFCITLARTRGVWLGITLGVLCVGLIGARYCIGHGAGLRWLGNFAAGTFLILAGLAMITFKVLPAFHYGIDIQDRLMSDKEIKSRVFYWRAAIDMAMQNRVFGKGYAMFDPLFWDYALEQQQSEQGPFYYDILPSISGRTPGHVHNEYLEVLAEQGFAGFIALVAFLAFFLFFGYWGIMNQRDPGRALQNVAIFGAYIAGLTDALFSFPWRLPASLIVFMVVLAWLYETIYPQEEDRSQKPESGNQSPRSEFKL